MSGKVKIDYTRIAVTEPGLAPGSHFLLTYKQYSVFLRCPPTSSCAFVDGYTLPVSLTDLSVVMAFVERIVALGRSEKTCIKVLVESRDSVVLHALREYEFSQTASYGNRFELTRRFA